MPHRRRRSSPLTRKAWIRPLQLLSLAVVALMSGIVFALPTPVHPEITRLRAEVAAARGPLAYPALRALFAQWDLADPAQVEEAITAVSESTDVPPPIQVYAQILKAQARTRRGDADGGGKLMSRLGFIDSWLFVGPFDDENRTGFAVAHQPETELSEPIVPGRAFDGKERPVRWRDAPSDRVGAVLDFGDWLRPREGVCGYATTFVQAKEGTKPRKIGLWVGAEGAFKLFWNGELVLEDPAYRGLDFDRSATEVDLAAGINRLTIKVCSDVSSPKIAVRVADSRGAPDLGVQWRSDPALSNEAKKPAAAAKDAKAKVAQRGLQGPVQAFERLVAGAKPSATDLEAYARYLRTTAGDPRGEHRARDLAARAAENEPTIDRLLLAAELAEDRNQARAWIEKAKARSTKNDPRGRMAVSLAEARLARTGISWRDAVPFFEEVRALDPDNVTGILGEADLYVQAKLPRTAVALLEGAVERQPRCGALLRAFAAQLRAVGRDTEAEEIEARAYAYRSDDSAFAARQVDRAVARREPAVAERWLARLRRSEPDLVFAETVAARAYRSLGEHVKAKRALEAALEIAPEDANTLRALSDLAGEEGKRDEQIRHLRKILTLYPQAKEVRAYVEFLAPSKPRLDESYAWDKTKLAELATKPPGKEKKRTLRNLAVTTVFDNGLASRFHQVAFQPLTDEAAGASRQYSFSYHADKQEVELRTARVYRADGSVAEAIESGEAAANDPSIAMYTSVRTFYVQFPKLEAGDIVELRYRIEDVTPRNDVADSFGEIEFMQSDEPILSSEYVLVAPKARTFVTHVANMSGLVPEIVEQEDKRIHRFAAKDVPPLVPEPAMPPWSEVLGQVHVSTFKSWEDLGRWYWGLARDQLDVDDEVRKKVREIVKDLPDDAAKVRAVYRYATLLRYVALELGIEGIKPRRCALTLARGWGDCKDKATVIVTMLREIGIPSTLVLVRTGQRGDLPKGSPASLSAFDHAIAYVPSLDLYLDGTAEGSGSTELPSMDRGSVGLLINEGNAKLVRLPDAPAESSPHERKLELSLAPDGAADFKFETSVRGVNAAAWRQRYQPEGTRRDRATRDLSAFFGSVELSKEAGAVVVRDADDVEKPIGMLARGKAPTAARREGDALSVPVASSLELGTSTAALSTRKLDLLLGGLSSSSEERTIKLPAGMKPRRLPQAVKIDGPFGRVTLDTQVDGQKVIVKSSLALKKSRVAPSEYQAFRAFCRAADDALSQRLVVGP